MGFARELLGLGAVARGALEHQRPQTLPGAVLEVTCESVTFTWIWDCVSSGLGLFSPLFVFSVMSLAFCCGDFSILSLGEAEALSSLFQKENKPGQAGKWLFPHQNKQGGEVGGKQVLLAGFWLSLGDLY